MKRRVKKVIAVASAIPLVLGGSLGLQVRECKAQNPIVQTIYTTDPAPMVYNETCYVYTGHDEDGAEYYDMRDWHCYSTKDMQNWTDLGSPMSYKTFSWATGDAWAGQVIERNGKFYYYAPLAINGATAIGVGVSSSPEGPFTDAIGKPLIAAGYGNIDPTVYIDSDGQAYLYWGNPALKYVKLNNDMVSYSGSVQTVNLTPAGFGGPKGEMKTLYTEGPWFYKRNNLYYMIYAASGIPENICYSTSNSPTGPWTFRGVIMPTQGGSFTNHPGIVDYKGHSYFFYHNGQLPGGNGFQRSVAVEEFKYNPDGSIPTINMSKEGPAQLESFNPYVKTEAETICYESGVETERCGEGTMNVAFIENGDYVMVKGVDFGKGAKSFEARVASATNGGNIEIHLDSVNGTLVGTCPVSGTGAWQTYETKTCNVSGATGKHDLYFKFTGGSGSLFNFNWWRFISSDGSGTSSNVNEGETVRMEDGEYYIKNVNAQKYLQVTGNTGKAGQNVELGTGSGVAGQRWHLTNTSDGYVTLTSALGDYMLDVANCSSEDGANIGIYYGYSGDAQKYQVKATKVNGTYTIVTKSSNGTKALDASNFGKTDGTNVIQWAFTGNTNQQWVLERIK